MACYTFKLNDVEFLVSSPNGDGTQLSNFLLAIELLKKNDPYLFSLLLDTLQNRQEVPKPTKQQNRLIPFRILKNLAKSGILMEVLSKKQWNDQCDEWNKSLAVKVDSDARSFVKDGVIYVRQESFTVNDAMHELAHLILAVMRSSDFKGYQDFIRTFYQHPEVQKIAEQLKNVKTYSDNYELDFQEEAIVRYLEGIFTGNNRLIPNFTMGDMEVDTMNYLNNVFRNPIKQTFGITNFPGITTIFKSLLLDIPSFGSDMFVTRPIESTGYQEMKRKIIETQLINALINYYASDEGGNIIMKGNC